MWKYLPVVLAITACSLLYVANAKEEGKAGIGTENITDSAKLPSGLEVRRRADGGVRLIFPNGETCLVMRSAPGVYIVKGSPFPEVKTPPARESRIGIPYEPANYLQPLKESVSVKLQHGIQAIQKAGTATELRVPMKDSVTLVISLTPQQ